MDTKADTLAQDVQNNIQNNENGDEQDLNTDREDNSTIPDTDTTMAEPREDLRLTTLEEDSAFNVLAGNIALCLYKSDVKRDDGFDGASTGWTSWVDDEAAIRLRSCMGAIELTNYMRQSHYNSHHDNNNDKNNKIVLDNDETMILRRDEAIRWIRWIKACPAPVMIELSSELRDAVNATIPSEEFLREIDSDRDDFLQRIGCRLILLPSGATLTNALRAPPGAMIYGKLLLGGVTRFRMIGSSRNSQPRRRAGARTVITSPQTVRTDSWLQYGGPERSYEAIDAGACVFLEVLILPKGLSLPLLQPASNNVEDLDQNRDSQMTEPDEGIHGMTISQMKLNLRDMLDFVTQEETNEHQGSDESQGPAASHSFGELGALTGKEYTYYLESSFSTSVGGLRPQILSIIRRVLDGRAITSYVDGTVDNADQIRRQEMEALLDLGLQPVRGLLLFGPPGGGKTLVAREISKLLNARPPKVVAAPELLDRWVGGSEKLVRELFQDAEEELRLCNGDPTKSALHVVVIDEIDAVFRRRSSSSQESSGEITRASACNALLTKLDGVNELGNILVIGMTNRKELLDEALLRPGRLEVQVEIPLPDQQGRREILKIHFEALRRRGLLSKSLCDAIDGRTRIKPTNSNDSFLKRGLGWLPKLSLLPRKRKTPIPNLLRNRQIRDLASDRWTGGFSGADIAGMVRAAGSLALARARKQDGGGLENFLITLEDVAKALHEIKQ